MPYTIVLIQNFELFRPSILTESETTNISHASERKEQYFVHPYHMEEYGVDCYHHYPLILDPKGAPFYNGNKFMLCMMQEDSLKIKKRDRTTYEGYAKDIAGFMTFIEEYEEQDYLISRSPISTPIARFRRDVEDKIILGGSTQYSKQKIARVVMFYRFLQDDLGYKFSSCPWWEDVEVSRHYTTDKGTIFSKAQLSSTIQQITQRPKQTHDEDSLKGVVKDGGECLRPLPDDETGLVIQALAQLGNIEMTLIHYIILFTGARTQTACTLRQDDFDKTPKEGEREIYIHAGPNCFADSKGDRPFIIKMPVEIYNRVRTYMRSERAQRRYENADFIFDDPRHQYVFITTQGKPYYISKSDPNLLLQKHPPVGKGVMEFVRGILRPKLAELGFEDPKKRFRTHFLRATYGMNRLEGYLAGMPPDIKDNKKGLFITECLKKTKTDMNHRNMKTTQLYLNLRGNKGLVHEANDAYDKHLASHLKFEVVNG